MAETLLIYSLSLTDIILRGCLKRWLQYHVKFPVIMMIESEATGTLSYAHHNNVELAILVGISFKFRAAK